METLPITEMLEERMKNNIYWQAVYEELETIIQEVRKLESVYLFYITL